MAPKHQIELYDSTSSQLAVNKPTEPVEWSRQTAGDLTLLRVGTQDQNVLGLVRRRSPHQLGLCLCRRAERACQVGHRRRRGPAKRRSSNSGELPGADDTRMPRAANDDQPVMAFAFDLGSVGAEAVQRQVIVAYDEIFAIKYFGKKLLPYWGRNGAKTADLLQTASRGLSEACSRAARPSTTS